jgi:hypothetical protein
MLVADVGRIGNPRPIGNRPLRTVYNRTGAIGNRPQDSILPHNSVSDIT